MHSIHFSLVTQSCKIFLLIWCIDADICMIIITALSKYRAIIMKCNEINAKIVCKVWCTHVYLYNEFFTRQPIHEHRITKASHWHNSNEFVKYVGVCKCYGCLVTLYPGQARSQGESVLENRKQKVEVLVEMWRLKTGFCPRPQDHVISRVVTRL